MSIKHEPNHAGEFLLSEANGTRSRATKTITGGKYPAGQVLGEIAANKKLTAYSAGASDGSETAVAILYSSVDAATADKSGVVIAMDAEVSKALLVDDDADAITDLAAVGIIAR